MLALALKVLRRCGCGLQVERAFRPSPFLRRMAPCMYLTWSAHRLPSLCRVCCLPQATEAGTEAEAPCPVQPLIDRARAMFSGGAPSSGPKASGEGQAASAASDGLLVDAVAAIAAVMKRCKRKGRWCQPPDSSNGRLQARGACCPGCSGGDTVCSSSRCISGRKPAAAGGCDVPGRPWRATTAPLPSGSGSSIPSPAGGLRVVGLSFIGLLGLDHALCM